MRPPEFAVSLAPSEIAPDLPWRRSHQARGKEGCHQSGLPSTSANEVRIRHEEWPRTSVQTRAWNRVGERERRRAGQERDEEAVEASVALFRGELFEVLVQSGR